METISETSVLQSILPISNNGGKKSLFIDTSSPLIANSNNSNSNMHALLTAPTDMTSLPVMSPMPMPGMSSMGGVAGMDAPEFGLTSQTIKVMDVLSQR
jgi:hypothetical protein